MKPSDITDMVEEFLIRAKYFWQDLVDFLFQLAVWIVGWAIIVFLELKEFWERRIKK